MKYIFDVPVDVTGWSRVIVEARTEDEAWEKLMTGERVVSKNVLITADYNYQWDSDETELVDEMP